MEEWLWPVDETLGCWRQRSTGLTCLVAPKEPINLVGGWHWIEWGLVVLVPQKKRGREINEMELRGRKDENDGHSRKDKREKRKES